MPPAATDERVLHVAQRATDAQRPTDWLVRAVVGAGAAAAVLTGADGEAGWRLVRVVAVAVATAAVITLVRSGGSGRSAAATAVGVGALAVAAGFGPHWFTGRITWVAVASIVLGAAGAVLVVLGVGSGIAGTRWWRRSGTVAGVLVALLSAAYVVGPAVAATNVPRPDLGETPDRVGLAAADVVVRTADGVDLAGWYVGSANRAAVVLLHGAGSTRSDVLPHASVIARAGFGVLMIDARGHGASSGRAMDFGWYGDLDVAAATAFLAARPDVDPTRIGVVGMSMGGEEALGASGRDPLVRAVVAEGATARCAGDEAWLSDEFGVRGAITERLEQVQDWVTDVLTDADVPETMRAAVATTTDTHYLLITAGRVPDEASAAAFIITAAPDRVETWTVAGADHTGGLATQPDEWAARVTAFLTGALLAGNTTRP